MVTRRWLAEGSLFETASPFYVCAYDIFICIKVQKSRLVFNFWRCSAWDLPESGNPLYSAKQSVREFVAHYDSATTQDTLPFFLSSNMFYTGNKSCSTRGTRTAHVLIYYSVQKRVPELAREPCWAACTLLGASGVSRAIVASEERMLSQQGKNDSDERNSCEGEGPSLGLQLCLQPISSSVDHAALSSLCTGTFFKLPLACRVGACSHQWTRSSAVYQRVVGVSRWHQRTAGMSLTW